MRADWPDLHGNFADPAAEDEFQLVMAIVEEVRGHRQAAGAPPRGGQLHLEGAVHHRVAALVARLAQVELVDGLERGTPLAGPPARVAFPSRTGDARREKERRRLEEDPAKIAARLANPQFPAHAPAEVVD